MSELTAGRGERREEDFHEKLVEMPTCKGCTEEMEPHRHLKGTARYAGTQKKKKNERMASRNARTETIS